MTTTQHNGHSTGSQLRDLAGVLIEGRVAAVAYIDLGQLIYRAEDEDVDPRAVAIARGRLEAARDRGNSIATDILRQLAEADES